MAGIVYEIPCLKCKTVSIGETGKSLMTRKKELTACVHLDNVTQSALASHANSTGHDIDWNNTKVLAQEQRWKQRKVLEAWLIGKNKNMVFN